MPAVISKTILLGHTPDPISVIYAACRQCYFSGFVGDLWENLKNIHSDEHISITKQEELIKKIIDSGHTSTVEHVSFTFAIEGISRALSHQMVRHRIASYSQQSQRYVEGSQCNYIVPPAIAKNPKALKRFEKFMIEVGSAYTDIHTLLEADGQKTKANEDARFVLPQAAETRIVLTMNCRSLLNFFEHRCCNRAQWEIRKVANDMLKICREILPPVFAHAGAPCEKTKICPEGKFCCGNYNKKRLLAKTLTVFFYIYLMNSLFNFTLYRSKNRIITR